MLTKILFTALVIAVVVAVARYRARRMNDRQRPVVINPHAATPSSVGTVIPYRLLGYSLLAVMIAGTTLYFYLDWEENRRVVSVRVINIDSGQSTTYRAYRGDVDGRRFETLDGRVVTLADAERMELVVESRVVSGE